MTILRLRAAVLPACICAIASAQGAEEYRIKAAFLLNLTKFVEWPAQTFESPAQAIVICVLGKNPFGDALHQAVLGKTVQERPLVVKNISRATDCASCQIVFITPAEWKRARPVFEAGGLRMLTVGDAEPFASEGGLVNFKIESGRVRLQINPDAAERKQLRISSKLLSLAEIVK